MAVNLSPVGGAAAQFFDNSGQVLTGGLLYTYLAGTTTPATTYTTNSGITAHPNPIVFNAAGRVPDSGEIWLSDGILYKFVLKDANDVLIASYDNIDGINSNFVAYATQSETIVATQGQTVFTLTTIQYTPATDNLAIYVNGSKQILTLNYTETSGTVVTFVDGLNVGDVVQFTTASPVSTNAVQASNVSYNEGSTGAIDRNVQSRLQDCVSVKDFGAVGDGTTDDTSAINTAFSAINAGQIKGLYFPGGRYVISGALTTITQSNISLYGVGSTQSVILQTANTNTLTFSSSSPTTQQINGISVMDLGIDQGSVTAPTGGVALTLIRATICYFSDFDIRSVFSGILIQGGNDIHFDSMTVTGAYSWTSLATNSYLLSINKYTAANDTPSEIFFSNFNIKGYGIYTQPSYLDSCVKITCGDGIWFDTGHLGFSSNAPFSLVAQNDAASYIVNIEVSNVYFDGNGAGDVATSCIVIGGSSTSVIQHVKFDACVIKGFDGNGLDVNLSSLTDLRFTDGLIAECGSYGAIFQNVNEIIFASNVVSKNNINNNSSDAVYFNAAQNVICEGNLILAGTSPHPNGVQITATSRDMILSDNIFKGHTRAIYVVPGAARITFSSNRLSGSNPTVVAADPLVPPLGFNVVQITGNTNFSSISAADLQGEVITFIFTGTPTVFDGAGNLNLTGNFTATAGSTLTLVNSGTAWSEVSRAVV